MAMNPREGKKDLASWAGQVLHFLTLILMAAVAPSWYDEFESNIIKFVAGVPIILTFNGAVPLIKDVTWKDGTKGKMLVWDVTVNEGGKLKKKCLPVTSKRLKDLLMAQDKKASLQGRTFKITAFGDGLMRNWTVEEVQL
jgi:hypothetical protein